MQNQNTQMKEWPLEWEWFSRLRGRIYDPTSLQIFLLQLADLITDSRTNIGALYAKVGGFNSLALSYASRVRYTEGYIPITDEERIRLFNQIEEYHDLVELFYSSRVVNHSLQYSETDPIPYLTSQEGPFEWIEKHHQCVMTYDILEKSKAYLKWPYIPAPLPVEALITSLKEWDLPHSWLVSLYNQEFNANEGVIFFTTFRHLIEDRTTDHRHLFDELRALPYIVKKLSLDVVCDIDGNPLDTKETKRMSTLFFECRRIVHQLYNILRLGKH